MKVALIGALLVILAASQALAVDIRVCFSPPLPGGCDPATTVIQAIDGARKSVWVQAYALTSRPIVGALVAAHGRGIDVRAIVDRKQLKEDRSDDYGVGRLLGAGIAVLVDGISGLMHDKIMIIDGSTVITGSFNFTWSAENRNAENLLVILDPEIVAQYRRNWELRSENSQPLDSVPQPAYRPKRHRYYRSYY